MKPYYQDSAVTIYHGECREILPELLKVDLLLTDPPYGLDVVNTMAKQSGSQYGAALAPKRVYEPSEWDRAPVDRELLLLCIKAARHQIIWGGNFYELPPAPCWLVWDKDNGTNGFADCELAWTNLAKAVRRYRHLWNGMFRKDREQREHPTQKPVDVMAWSIRQAPEDVKVILDPFMGSGTTLRAAKDLRRHAIGIEIEERYCEIAARRMAQEVLNFAA